ncbi:MAG: RNA polymerase sigma factor [Cyclobacteriaceae bacterium]
MSRIFDQHIMPASPKMFRYAISILKDPDAAGDVVQECLAKIWQKRSILQDVQNYEAWAMRIVRNQCLDWVKLNRYTVLGPEHEKTTNMNTDSQLIMDDQLKWLASSLDQLPKKQQEVYHLREVEELSYQEIAEVLTISIDDVKVCIHRARNHVRNSLQQLDAYGIAN